MARSLNRRQAFMAAIFREITRLGAFYAFSHRVSIQKQRKRSDLLASLVPRPRGIAVEKTTLGKVPCEQLTPKGADPGAALLYLHGGGWILGSSRTHRVLAARMAKKLGVTAWVLDYRLVPEHDFPAGLEDCVAAYRALHASGVSRVMVAGDSAGGGLSASVALVARDEGLPIPAAIGMISPGVDSTPASGESLKDSWREPFISADFVRELMQGYVGTESPSNPLLSPLYADLRGFPPVVLDSSGDDVIVGQGLQFVEAVRGARGYVDHKHYPGLWHVFHSTAGVWPYANAAVDDFATRLDAASRTGALA